MPTVVLSTPPYLYFADNDGNPLSGGKIETYLAGTTTPQATYTDASGTVANSNPVICDSSGRTVIFLDNSVSYKYIVKDSLNNIIRTVDNITPFTASGSIASGSVTNAMLANMAANTVKVRAASTTGVPSDLAIGASQLVGRGSTGDMAAITVGSGLTMSGTTLSAAGGTPFADNSYLYFDTFDDFMGKAAASYSGATSGAGAVSGPTGLAYFVVATGSTATGRASMRSGGVAAGNLYTALTNSTFSVNVDVEALSDAGQTYTARVGYTNSDTGDPTDGIYFRYTHGTNSGNWQAVCRSGGVESVINSSSPPLVGLGTVNQTLSFVGRSSSSVEFFINNTSIGTISTNVPAFSSLIAGGGGGSIIKGVGTTSRSMDLAQLKTRRYR